jgi:transposase
MHFIGIDPHTNRFTWCYRTERSSLTNARDKRTETFELTGSGLQAFYQTLTPESFVLAQATITTFSFLRLFRHLVKEVVVANSCELKQISLARCNTDKIDAEKLCRIIKMQVLCGERLVSPVTVAPKEIQDLRALFSTYRLMKKQIVQLKNRIHSLLKEQLYGFTREEIFGKKRRGEIRELSKVDEPLGFQVQLLLDRLERDEGDVDVLKERILMAGAPFMREIDILSSMKGISVFIALAIIADVITVSRIKNSKAFSWYLRSAPKVASSNTSTEAGIDGDISNAEEGGIPLWAGREESRDKNGRLQEIS